MIKQYVKSIFKSIINLSIVRYILLELRRIYATVFDVYESLFGLRDELTPPKRMNFVGDGDFRKIGEDFLELFVKKGGLKKTDKILDVGCGIGRMAIPLTKYLSIEGSYDGIDIVPAGINWCDKKITPAYPNFKFHLADVFNKVYNAKSSHKPGEYKFPFQDQSFDFIFLTSVFTHMLEEDMEHYFTEISRVIKQGGKCFITFFLLNQESLNHIYNKLSIFDFKYSLGNCHFEYKNTAESAISYDEGFVRNLYEKNMLKITEPILFGSWCGRTNYLSFQDIIIAVKK